MSMSQDQEKTGRGSVTASGYGARFGMSSGLSSERDNTPLSGLDLQLVTETVLGKYVAVSGHRLVYRKSQSPSVMRIDRYEAKG